MMEIAPQVTRLRLGDACHPTKFLPLHRYRGGSNWDGEAVRAELTVWKASSG